MIVSTKGRYALRVMIDLAEHQTERYVPLKEVAARQEISEKYLENILKVLVQNGFLEGLRGKGGGLNQVARDQQHTQLAELGVDAVIHKGQQRVGDAVQNTGAGQDDANRGGGNAVADAGRIAGHSDERVDAHTDQCVAGVADDLPCFGAAVLYAVNF